MTEFTVKFSPEAINTVLAHLDQGPHREVRRVIDDIINQINAQQTPPEPPTPGDQDQQ